MLVHRIEHLEYGHGPLCLQGFTHTDIAWSSLAHYHHNLAEEYPELLPDGVNEELHKFGMSSKDALFGVFIEQVLPFLEELGYAYYTLEVPDGAFIVFPDNQVIFDHTQATVVTIEDLPSI